MLVVGRCRFRPYFRSCVYSPCYFSCLCCSRRLAFQEPESHSSRQLLHGERGPETLYEIFKLRLDRDSVDLERKLEGAQESVVSLMDKKEVLEATRHVTLVKCLQEVNGALGGIYRRLTSVEGMNDVQQ